MSTKHDIETAPKDGTRILLLGGSYWDMRPAVVGQPGPAEIRSPMVARWVVPRTKDATGCWLIVETGDGDWVEYHNATHWMALPAA